MLSGAVGECGGGELGFPAAEQNGQSAASCLGFAGPAREAA